MINLLTCLCLILKLRCNNNNIQQTEEAISRCRLIDFHVDESPVTELVMCFPRLEALANSFDGPTFESINTKTEYGIREDLCLAFESNSESRFQRLDRLPRTVTFKLGR